MAHDDLVTIGWIPQFGDDCPLRIQERIETGLVIILENNSIGIPLLLNLLILAGNILVERRLIHKYVTTYSTQAIYGQRLCPPVSQVPPLHGVGGELVGLGVLVNVVSLVNITSLRCLHPSHQLDLLLEVMHLSTTNFHICGDRLKHSPNIDHKFA